MDYKKKYEEVLERGTRLWESGTITLEDYEYMFPEIKESEDEKIRKSIIRLIQRGGYMSPEDKDKAYAWLEKQGERKKNVVDIISDLENYFATTTKEQQEKDWDEIKNWEEKHFNHDRHIEQKPTDEAEPKFKVGDWIINSEGMLRHILDVDKTGYQTDNGWLTHDIYDNAYHIWTIQDAKKGDILQADKCTLIFNSLIKDIDGNTVISSWYYCDTKTFYGMGTSQPDLWVTEGVVPATKEQCDIFFAKMKEAGYEWDAEKKELKKIEPKNIEGTFVNVDEVREDFINEVYRVLDSDPNNDRANQIINAFDSLPTIVIENQGEQNPAWSEEDEKMLECCKIALNMFKELGKNSSGFPRPNYFDLGRHIYPEEVQNWLKSLKERYTWKPSDEQIETLLKLEEMHVLEHEKNQENAHLYMVVKSIREQLLKLKGK